MQKRKEDTLIAVRTKPTVSKTVLTGVILEICFARFTAMIAPSNSEGATSTCFAIFMVLMAPADDDRATSRHCCCWDVVAMVKT